MTLRYRQTIREMYKIRGGSEADQLSRDEVEVLNMTADEVADRL